METTYKLNASEVSPSLLTSIRDLYLDRDIEITVRETPSPLDETEYLLQSPTNAARLSKAIENIERGENLVSFENIEQAMQYAEEQAAH